MSVRATERLIGDLVSVTAMPGSPHMVVKGISEETKIITTVWFAEGKQFQEGAFPAQALDRVEAKKAPQKATSTGAKKKAKR